jgi:hypothetical protein
MDFRDWFVVGLIISVALFGAIFVAKHPDPLNFATFATLIGTLTGFYHFMVIRDSKQADA